MLLPTVLACDAPFADNTERSWRDPTAAFIPTPRLGSVQTHTNMLTLPLILTPRVVIGAICIVRRVNNKKKNPPFDYILNESFSLPHMACAAAAADGLVGLLPRSEAGDAERAAASQQRSLFRSALERMPTVHDAHGNILTDGFLDICTLTLPLIGQCGGGLNGPMSAARRHISASQRGRASGPRGRNGLALPNRVAAARRMSRPCLLYTSRRG